MRELNDKELEVLLGEDFRTCYSGHVAEYRSIAKAQFQADIKGFIEWMDEICREHGHTNLVPRRRCGVCLESLKQLVDSPT